MLGVFHPNTLNTTTNLSFAYFNLRRFDKAIWYGEDCLNKSKEAFGEFHQLTFFYTTRLANIYLRRGQDEKDLIKSLEMLKANFANCKERLGADNKNTKECLELLLEVARAKARNARP